MNGRAKTVLLVEDHPLNMQLASELLSAGGFEVLQAGEAEEGLRIARAERPGLILMDIQLPGLDGLSAVRRLRDDPQTRDIPVVVLSAHVMERDEQAAREAGAVGYIGKPIDTRTFVETVRSHLTTAPPTERSGERGSEP